jgi:glycosyltransferase involved in cell wall biosynthesis
MRKNILILAHNYGMQFLESCNQYTQLFDKNQYSVTVAFLTGPEDDQIRARTWSENVLFMQCPSRKLRGLKIGVILRLLKLCREKQFEMVICHRYKPSYIMMWVAQFCQIPSLFFCMHALGTMHTLPRKLVSALLHRKNMYFVGVSDAVRDDIRQDLWRVPKKHTLTLHNIIDHQLFEPQLLERNQARQDLHLPEHAFVFGHLGRLVEAKDQKTLIHAFSLIKPSCPQAKLIILGDGRLEGELKQLAHDLHLTHDVIFAGFIPDGFRYMKAFDVLVLCSVEEAFGRVLLEAMVARIPMIAARANGMPEVVGDAGFLVEPANSQQLAQAMQKFVGLPLQDLINWGEKGYQRMLQYFTFATFKETFWQTLRG